VRAPGVKCNRADIELRDLARLDEEVDEDVPGEPLVRTFDRWLPRLDSHGCCSPVQCSSVFSSARWASGVVVQRATAPVVRPQPAWWETSPRITESRACPTSVSTGLPDARRGTVTPGAGVSDGWETRGRSPSQPEDQVAYGGGLGEERVVAGFELHYPARPAGVLALHLGWGASVLGADEIGRGHVSPGR